MFTGIIEEKGTIKNIENNKDILKVRIKTHLFQNKLKIGDSISVDGICSTVIDLGEDDFLVDYMQETLKKTIASKFCIGREVNLELPMSTTSRFDGHFVQGHVDFVGEVLDVIKRDTTMDIYFSFPKDFRKYISKKGSITINGTSLTLVEVLEDRFSVCLIPHTIKWTNLGNLKIGDKVNIEIDMLARYIENLITNR